MIPSYWFIIGIFFLVIWHIFCRQVARAIFVCDFNETYYDWARNYDLLEYLGVPIIAWLSGSGVFFALFYYPLKTPQNLFEAIPIIAGICSASFFATIFWTFVVYEWMQIRFNEDIRPKIGEPEHTSMGEIAKIYSRGILLSAGERKVLRRIKEQIRHNNRVIHYF